MSSLNFRQIHLDFHTSELIKDIGSQFKKKQFQDALKTGFVDSVTVFSKCHHGWAYHPTEANTIHPELSFDLLGSMIQAAHEIDIKTPVYISAGFDEKLARKKPEWLSRNKDESIMVTPDFQEAGYHLFCFNTPYLEVLLQQVAEVVKGYDADGIFMDIASAHLCYCQKCVTDMLSEGMNPYDVSDNMVFAERVYANYASSVREVIDTFKSGLPVFHNGGHIVKGRNDLVNMNTHLELESLPTGGWSYDHFPMSAKYTVLQEKEFLGMTGKFHNTWGEFGGFKHPNALIYETSLNIALGAKCSIGDQLHPFGEMDMTTYEIIGKAYSLVKEKEPWCQDIIPVSQVAILSMESMECHLPIDRDTQYLMDIGVNRMMLQSHYLYDIIDRKSPFEIYKVIIFPDTIRFDENLTKKVEKYIQNGGKVLLTGESGLKEVGDENGQMTFALDIGGKWMAKSSNKPNYFRPRFNIKSFKRTSFIMNEVSETLELTNGRSLGDMESSFFNRTRFEFCSHQHSPSSMNVIAPGMIKGEHSVYIPWKIFSDYTSQGALHLREIIEYSIDLLLGEDKALITNLPSQGMVSLMRQKNLNRDILHLIYAAPVMKGYGNYSQKPLSVIEDLIPIRHTEIQLKVNYPIKRLVLVPQMEDIDYKIQNGRLHFIVDEFVCHQMVSIEYE